MQVMCDTVRLIVSLVRSPLACDLSPSSAGQPARNSVISSRSASRPASFGQAREEGFSALYRGMGVRSAHALSQAFVYFFAYNLMRRNWEARFRGRTADSSFHSPPSPVILTHLNQNTSPRLFQPHPRASRHFLSCIRSSGCHEAEGQRPHGTHAWTLCGLVQHRPDRAAGHASHLQTGERTGSVWTRILSVWTRILYWRLLCGLRLPAALGVASGVAWHGHWHGPLPARGFLLSSSVHPVSPRSARAFSSVALLLCSLSFLVGSRLPSPERTIYSSPQTLRRVKVPPPVKVSPRADRAPASADGGDDDGSSPSASGRGGSAEASSTAAEADAAAAAATEAEAAAAAVAAEEARKRKALSLYSSLHVSLLLAFTPSIQARVDTLRREPAALRPASALVLLHSDVVESGHRRSHPSRSENDLSLYRTNLPYAHFRPQTTVFEQIRTILLRRRSRREGAELSVYEAFILGPRTLLLLLIPARIPATRVLTRYPAWNARRSPFPAPECRSPLPRLSYPPAYPPSHPPTHAPTPGAFAKACASVVMYPVIRTKVVLQAGSLETRTIAGTMRELVAREGPSGLYKGIQAQMLRTVVVGALLLMARSRPMPPRSHHHPLLITPLDYLCAVSLHVVLNLIGM